MVSSHEHSRMVREPSGNRLSPCGSGDLLMFWLARSGFIARAGRGIGARDIAAQIAQGWARGSNPMPVETARVRPPFAPPLDLPPPYRLVTLREVGDAFAHARPTAADEGAGTLVWVGR